MKLIRTLLVACAFFAANAHAQDDIAELKREIAVRDQAIRNLIERVERLEAASGTRPTIQPAAVRTPDPPPQQLTPRESAEAVQAQDVARIRTAFERTLIDRGGLTLPKWSWEIDSALNYSHSSSEKLTIDGFTVYPVLIVGDIVSERVRRDTLGTNITARMGLPWQMQVDVRVPYSYENSSRLAADGKESALADSGLGDIEIGLSRPLFVSRGGGLDLLGAVRWKTTTGRDPFGIASDRVPFGTGFSALSTSVTAVATQDPMVFFGTLTYTDDVAARKGGRRIDPGDSFGLQLGTALAVNLDTSITFGYQQQFTTRSRADNVAVPGSYINTSTLSIGLSHALSTGTSFETDLAIGLSEDSPDLQLSFSMPFKLHR